MEFNSAAGPGTTPSRASLRQHFEYLQKSHENIGGSSLESSSSNIIVGHQIVDGTNAATGRPLNLIERFVTVLDRLDAHVEKFRKHALMLQEKRDYLLMSIDLIKSDDSLQNMSEPELDEIYTYIQRVNARLATVELNVRTVRDAAQQDSLSQVNSLIDMIIAMGDPVFARQRCQQYLNTCCGSTEIDGSGGGGVFYTCISKENSSETDLGPIDKNFESALLGCTIDDQKNIKKRLHALMDYLNKQIISHTVEAKSSY